jgi:hypothetical protein
MTRVFKNTGEDFSGYHAATDWLTANGYSYGSMQRGAPTGIVKGDCGISKWRNMNRDEIKSLDGRIEIADFIRDDVTVTIFAEVPAKSK